ncbi:MAG: carboxypeptidase regulatory-like domain-containing protein [Ignavibacteriaceae bacterium]
MKKMRILLVVLTLAIAGLSSTYAQLAAPTDLTAQAVSGTHNSQKVKLSWLHSDTTNHFVRFSIYKKIGAIADTGIYKKIATISSKTFYDLNVAVNGTYSYYVVAVQGLTVSDPSNSVEITLVPPPPPPSALVTGIITNETTGNPIINAFVKFFKASNSTPSTGTTIIIHTDSLGQFSANLLVGNYYLYTSAAGYVAEYFDNVTTLQNATQISVVDGVTQNINVALAAFVPPPPPPPPAYATVYGVVTDETTLALINKACVKFFSGNSHPMTRVARTDSLGQYIIKLPVGEFYIYTSALGYVPEYYDNVNTIQAATKLTLADGDSVNINVALAGIVPPVLYTLSGSVKDSLGNPLAAKVRVYKVRLNSHFQMTKEVKTDSLGNFVVNVKENDTLIVLAQPLQLLDFYSEFWENKTLITEADKLPVTGNITGIDFVLTHKPVYANGISGIVKDTLNIGVESLVHAIQKYMNVHPIINNFHPRRYTTTTDTLGAYSFSNLFPNQYILLAVPQIGFKPSYFRYDGVPTLNWRLADSVIVTETGVVPDINITVNALPDSGFAQMRGIVRDNNGKEVNGAFVYAVNTSNEVYGYAISDINGRYTIAGLVPDDYLFLADKEGYTSNNSQTANINYSSTASNINFTLETDGVTEVNNDDFVVTDYALYQNYPNPFNPSTIISYQIPVSGKVSLKVFNVLGNEVATLVDGIQNSGKHSVSFNASQLATGVYFYKLESDNFSATKKLMLIK